MDARAEITVHFSEEVFSGEESKLHWLPCAVDHVGKAKVSSYFKISSTKEKDSEVLISSLRGRELKGAQVSLPTGYQGIIVDNLSNHSGSAQVSGRFSSYTYWKREVTPSHRDKSRLWMDWLEVSAVVHQKTQLPEEVSQTLDSSSSLCQSESLVEVTQAANNTAAMKRKSEASSVEPIKKQKLE